MCDEAFDDYLAVLKFIPDWVVTNIILEKFDDALSANDDTLFLIKILVKSHYANQMGILGVDLDKINLDDDNNFYGDNLYTIIHVKRLAWYNKFEKRKALKKKEKQRINA